MSEPKELTPKELQREVDRYVAQIEFARKDMTEFDKFTNSHREEAEEALAFANDYNQVRLRSRAKYVLRLFECHDEDLLAQDRIKIVKEEIVGGKVVRQVRECAKTDFTTFENRGYELFEPKAKKAPKTKPEPKE